MDDDTEDKDDSKRKSRNLSEKKRRDQFNLLVNELSSMVSSTNRKMDKSTVLKSTIAFLKHHNEVTVRSRVHEIQEDWKPSFLSNEEFTHLILEALDGFIMVFSATGRIFYASESITSLLGHLPSDLLNMTIYDLAYEEDHSDLYNILLNPITVIDPVQSRLAGENQMTFSCHLKRGGLDFREEVSFELVQFIGYFRSDVDLDNMLPNTRSGCYPSDPDSRLIFVGTGRIQTPQLIREMSIVDSSKSEFTSRHSLEWKFLFLDHRAPPIIGYLPFEVLGTSGYDYYHFDDLEKVIQCHEALMQKGEGTSCYYRFLTKGQQWIWLQTRFYITYHQWSSKPEFVVCTHRVVSYADVMKQTRNNNSSGNTNNSNNMVKDSEDSHSNIDKQHMQISSSSMPAHSSWSSKNTRQSRFAASSGSMSVKGKARHSTYRGNGSDSTSLSTDSHTSHHSLMTQHSTTRSRMRHSTHQGQKQESQQKIIVQQHQLPLHSIQQAQSAMIPPQIHHHGRGLPPMMSSTFVEPQQYLAAIPVQPVIAAPYPGTAAVISPIQPNAEILPSGVIMTSTQTQIQDQLQRKHEELQQLIVQQQEELRRVSEQLLMARYGLLPPIVNVPVSFANNQNSVDHMGTGHHHHHHPIHGHIQQHPHSSLHHHSNLPSIEHLGPGATPQPLDAVDRKSIVESSLGTSVSNQNEEMISYMQLTPVPTSHLHQMRIISDSQDSQPQSSQMSQQQMPMSNELEVLPYQMSQEQSQILFNSPNSPRQNQ